jgi:hypothetical protein
VVCDRNIITTLNTLTKQIKEYDYMIEVHVLKASLKFELLLLEFLLNSSTLISKRLLPLSARENKQENWMLPLSARKNKQENWMLDRCLSKIEGQLPQPATGREIELPCRVLVCGCCATAPLSRPHRVG